MYLKIAAHHICEERDKFSVFSMFIFGTFSVSSSRVMPTEM